MTRKEIIERLNKIVGHVVHVVGETPFVMSLDDGIAIHEAIEVLQQPEVIHCRDCKFWQDQEEGIIEVPICTRPENNYEKYPFVMLISGDGFCSYAERKSEDE